MLLANQDLERVSYHEVAANIWWRSVRKIPTGEEEANNGLIQMR